LTGTTGSASTTRCRREAVRPPVSLITCPTGLRPAATQLGGAKVMPASNFAFHDRLTPLERAWQAKFTTLRSDTPTAKFSQLPPTILLRVILAQIELRRVSRAPCAVPPLALNAPTIGRPFNTRVITCREALCVVTAPVGIATAARAAGIDGFALLAAVTRVQRRDSSQNIDTDR
jgi:hypothetical protein